MLFVPDSQTKNGNVPLFCWSDNWNSPLFSAFSLHLKGLGLLSLKFKLNIEERPSWRQFEAGTLFLTARLAE